MPKTDYTIKFPIFGVILSYYACVWSCFFYFTGVYDQLSSGVHCVIGARTSCMKLA